MTRTGQRSIVAPRDTAEQPCGDLPPYPSVPFVLSLAFCAYITLWYLHVSFRVPLLAQIRFELIAALGLFVAAVINGLSLRSPLTPFVGSLVAAIAFQIPFSVAPALSWTVFIDGVAKYMMVAIMIASFVRAPVHLRMFLGAFLLAMLKLGQEGVLGTLTGSLLWENQGVMRLHGPTPMYAHPNSFAGMAVGAMAFVVCLWPVAQRWERIGLLLLGGAAGAIVLFAGSRTGYIGAIGLAAVMIAKSRRTVTAIVVTSAVVILIAALAPEQYRERFETIFTQQDAEGHSTDLRKEILRDAWSIFLDHPLGVGVGAFPVVRMAKFGREQDTHNLVLEVATNLGIQGLLVFGAFVAVMVVQLERVAKRARSQISSLQGSRLDAMPHRAAIATAHIDDLRLICQAAVATQVFVLVRLTLGLFGMDLYEIYWWFASGLCIALYQMEAVAQTRTNTLLKTGPARTEEVSVPISPDHNNAAVLRGPRPDRRKRINWVDWQQRGARERANP